MNLVIDTYIFYADVYFVQNVMIKITVLYLSLYCNKCYTIVLNKKGVMRIILAASIGTIVEIIVLQMGNSYNLYLVLCHLCIIPSMIRFVVWKEQKQIFRLIVCGYFFVMIINAVLELIWNYFGDSGNYVVLLCMSCFLVSIGVHIYLQDKKMQKGIIPIQILHKGKVISAYGFYDSGNLLRDPYTQKGVHIVSERLCRICEMDKENAVLIPYHALGKDDGIIKVYYADELVIEAKGQKKQWLKCPLGVTNEDLFKNSKYEIILNEEVF